MEKMVIHKPKNLNDALTFLIIGYTISTMLQGIIPFSLNKLFVFVILLVLLVNAMKKMTIRRTVLFIYMFLLLLYNAFFSVDTNQAIHDWIYFFTTLLLLEYVTGNNLDALDVSFEKNKYLIKLITYVLFFITFISLFLSANYDFVWGDGIYFMGFVRNTHVMASSSCLLMALILHDSYEKDFSYVNMLMLLLMLFIIFQTGARTYIIPSSLMCYLYIKGKIKGKLKKTLLISIAIFAILLIFFKSGMYEKFLWSSNAENQWVTNSLTSSTGGRSVFWLIDLKAFINSNVFNFIFGHGFDYVFLLNEKMYGIRIWAHNDIINLLLSTGLFGTLYYLMFWKNFFKLITGKKQRIFLIIMLIYVLFPMIFNGMYTTQHYFFSVLILFITIRRKINHDNELSEGEIYG